MTLLFLYLLSVLICHISSHQLFELCVNSECVWQGEGLYGGCLPDHVTTLRFPYFDRGGVLDLRCTAVKIIFIENSPMSCGESFILGGTKGAVLYMNGIQCTQTHPTTAPTVTTRPTTASVLTARPTVTRPMTAHLTTARPKTAPLLTVRPTTARPTTARALTDRPTTPPPVFTARPTTAHPTTAHALTDRPTAARVLTDRPSTARSTTAVRPTRVQPMTVHPTRAHLVTGRPTTARPGTISSKGNPDHHPGEGSGMNTFMTIVFTA